jgi:UDP-3-O-[3-hydroxymyristoyl] N-acetylglucosamine deacetylase
MKKQTLGHEIGFRGQGVHSGRPVNMTVAPSASGRLVFRRRDLGGLEIPLDPMTAGARQCTFIQGPGAMVQTVEHLLAALRLAGIDSALIELDAEEVPILDGSAAPYVEALAEAGRSALSEDCRSLKVLEPFRLQEKDAVVAFEPGPELRVSYLIDFAHPLIGRMAIDLVLSRESFAADVAPARTFGFLKDVDRLRALGLSLGATYENTVVLDETTVVNPPLRFSDEFVRHKVLDIVGDLAAAGAPFLGHVRAERAGHALHVRALQSLLASPAAWTWAD